MKLKNKLAGLLSLSLLLGVLTVSSSAIDRENDVEFVLEMVTRTPGSEYAWNTDGGRETKIVILGMNTSFREVPVMSGHPGECGELEKCGHIVRILATMQQVSYRRECIMDCKL